MRRFRDTLSGPTARLQQALKVRGLKAHKGLQQEGEKQNSFMWDWVGARQGLEGSPQEGLQTSRIIFGSNSFKGDRNCWSFLVYAVKINFPSSMLFQQPCQKLTHCKRYNWYTEMYCCRCLFHLPFYTTTHTNNFPTLWDSRVIFIPLNKPVPIPMWQSALPVSGSQLVPPHSSSVMMDIW